MSVRGGRFSSKSDVMGNRQAAQVGRDIKPLTGWDKFRADMIGLNDDGTYNTWGQFQRQIGNWFGMGELSNLMQDAHRDDIMKGRGDDYARAWRSDAAQNEMHRQRQLALGQHIEGGKVAATVVTMGKSMGAGKAGAAAKGGALGGDAANAATADVMGPPTEDAPLMGPPDSYMTADDAAAMDGTGTVRPGLSLNEQDAAELQSRIDHNQMFKTFMGQSGRGQSPLSMTINAQTAGDERYNERMGELQSQGEWSQYTDAVPVIGGFIGKTWDLAQSNDVMGAVMAREMDNLERSLMLDDHEYA